MVYLAVLALLLLVCHPPGTHGRYDAVPADTGSICQYEGMTGSYNLTVCEMCHLTCSNMQELNFSYLDSDLALRKLSVVNSPNLTVIQEGDFDTYQLNNVTVLDLVNNSISEIKINAFRGLENLLYLYLDNNKLETIVLSYISDLKKLWELSLKNNLFKCFDGYTNIRSYLPKLSSINLSGNMLETLSTSFNDVLFLVGLDLENNKLSNIDQLDFFNLSGLYRLNLRDNNISSLHTNVFHYLDRLGFLDLSGNQMTTIETGAFTNLIHLTALNLSNNNLKEIRSDLFQGLTSLDYLNLGSNQISTINTGDLETLQNLTVLNIGYNNITVIRKGMFKGLTSLNHLYLKCNQITTIETGAFEDIRNLTHLSLSNNYLTVLSRDMFLGLTNLKYLDLDNNNKSMPLEKDLFDEMPKLRTVKIGGEFKYFRSLLMD